MIVGYHAIFSAYGFWLPNDPRGSWSDFVGSWELFRYGPATKTTERRSLAYRDHDRELRKAAKAALKYPPVQFTGVQARAIARGFARYVERTGLPVWACAILPDHVHLVVGRPPISVEQLVIQLKGYATQQLERRESIRWPRGKQRAGDHRNVGCVGSGRSSWTRRTCRVRFAMSKATRSRNGSGSRHGRSWFPRQGSVVRASAPRLAATRSGARAPTERERSAPRRG